MATPVGHALVGLGVHVLSARGPSEVRSAGRALALVVAATAADADLLFKLIDGRNHHQGATHSLGLALLVGLFVALGLRAAGRRDALRGGLAIGTAWFSHGVLDFLSGDTTPPFGPMLLWPFSGAHFLSPWPIFRDTVRSLSWSVVSHNALALAQELGILLPLLTLALRLRGVRGSAILAWLRAGARTGSRATAGSAASRLDRASGTLGRP